MRVAHHCPESGVSMCPGLAVWSRCQPAMAKRNVSGAPLLAAISVLRYWLRSQCAAAGRNLSAPLLLAATCSAPLLAAQCVETPVTCLQRGPQQSDLATVWSVDWLLVSTDPMLQSPNILLPLFGEAPGLRLSRHVGVLGMHTSDTPTLQLHIDTL